MTKRNQVMRVSGVDYCFLGRPQAVHSKMLLTKALVGISCFTVEKHTELPLHRLVLFCDHLAPAFSGWAFRAIPVPRRVTHKPLVDVSWMTKVFVW